MMQSRDITALPGCKHYWLGGLYCSLIAHVQSRNIIALPGVNFAFLAGSNEFEDEKCMYGNVSFRDTKNLTRIYCLIKTNPTG